MKFKGTQGKWEVGSSKRSVVNKDKVIAKMRFNDGLGIFENDEPEYNARLMSKAPEMLEKLQEIVENWKSGNEDNFIMANLIDDAEQIIKQATELKQEENEI